MIRGLPGKCPVSCMHCAATMLGARSVDPVRGHTHWLRDGLSRQAPPGPGRQRGYTLIELLIVIVLIGAMVGVSAVFIVEPFRASRDISERARLTDEAELVIDRLIREVRRALPNSVRVTAGGGRTAVEFVATRTGGRYRRLPPASAGGDTLNRARASDTFDVLGGLPGMGEVITGGDRKSVV